ncbi:hypothetical protein ASE82_02965 [Sphingomonas sp. Leaf230]|nr:hypothetical protein ASE82_02965 [Sphingomonas sp. Leaf230]
MMSHDNPERALALSYAPQSIRAAVTALFTLDDTLAAILRSTREPLIGQMRLTWWYEALGRLDTALAPAEPVLAALQNEVLPFGISGAMLGKLTDGWEALLEPDLDADAIERFARDRGRRLFDLAATIVSVTDDRIGLAGEGWALADLAQKLTETAGRELARVRASKALDQALQGRWPSSTRALGALAVSARFDMTSAAAAPGSPRRVARLAWHRLTGY